MSPDSPQIPRQPGLRRLDGRPAHGSEPAGQAESPVAEIPTGDRLKVSEGESDVH